MSVIQKLASSLNRRDEVKSIPVINEKNKALFVKPLGSPLNDIEKDTKRKRVEKVIKKFS